MRVLCVGEMLVDIIVRPVEQVLLQNDTQLVREIRFSSGGDANNNAINLARLGNQVTYIWGGWAAMRWAAMWPGWLRRRALTWGTLCGLPQPIKQNP